jgi:NADH dehydrogenase FAD-containing subunit
VLGDAARVLDPKGRTLPGLAAMAQQQGHYVHQLITARVEG